MSKQSPDRILRSVLGQICAAHQWRDQTLPVLYHAARSHVLEHTLEAQASANTEQYDCIVSITEPSTVNPYLVTLRKEIARMIKHHENTDLIDPWIIAAELQVIHHLIASYETAFILAKVAGKGNDVERLKVSLDDLRSYVGILMESPDHELLDLAKSKSGASVAMSA